MGPRFRGRRGQQLSGGAFRRWLHSASSTAVVVGSFNRHPTPPAWRIQVRQLVGRSIADVSSGARVDCAVVRRGWPDRFASWDLLLRV